jgi:hypothetical protein
MLPAFVELTYCREPHDGYAGAAAADAPIGELAFLGADAAAIEVLRQRLDRAKLQVRTRRVAAGLANPFWCAIILRPALSSSLCSTLRRSNAVLPRLPPPSNAVSRMMLTATRRASSLVRTFACTSSAGVTERQGRPFSVGICGRRSSVAAGRGRCVFLDRSEVDRNPRFSRRTNDRGRASQAGKNEHAGARLVANGSDVPSAAGCDHGCPEFPIVKLTRRLLMDQLLSDTPEWSWPELTKSKERF